MEPVNHEILLYSTPDGAVRVEVVFEDETFWLTQKKMAELFGIGVQTINHHLQEVYKSNELNEMETIRKFRIVQPEVTRQVAREVEFYNLGRHHRHRLFRMPAWRKIASDMRACSSIGPILTSPRQFQAASL
jgi:hypothetical protein